MEPCVSASANIVQLVKENLTFYKTHLLGLVWWLRQYDAR